MKTIKSLRETIREQIIHSIECVINSDECNEAIDMALASKLEYSTCRINFCSDGLCVVVGIGDGDVFKNFTLNFDVNFDDYSIDDRRYQLKCIEKAVSDLESLKAKISESIDC